MKKIKKILGVLCAITLTFSPWAPYTLATTTKNHFRRPRSRRVPTKILYDKDLPPLNVRMLKKYARRKETIDRMVAILKGQLKRNYDILILDGGTYGDTARADGFECHHLISSHFCRKHPSVLHRSKAPAVLIPKEIHDLTGSHPNSGQMLSYLEKEERIFNTHISIFGPVLGRKLGLEAILILGLNDLIESFRTYYRSGKKLVPGEILTLPEVKAAVSCISDDINPESLRSPPKPQKRQSTTTLRTLRTLRKASYLQKKDSSASRRHSEITQRDLTTRKKEKTKEEHQFLWLDFSYPMQRIAKWITEDLPPKRIKS